MTQHRLSLYFDKKYPDPIWANVSYDFNPDVINGYSQDSVFTIGRMFGCTIRLKSRTVSRVQLTFNYHSIRDLWSITVNGITNKIYLNAKILKHEIPVIICIGDKIWIDGGYLYIVPNADLTIEEEIKDRKSDENKQLIVIPATVPVPPIQTVEPVLSDDKQSEPNEVDQDWIIYKMSLWLMKPGTFIDAVYRLIILFTLSAALVVILIH